MNDKLKEYKEIAHRSLREHPWNKCFDLAEQKLCMNRDSIFNGMMIVASLCLIFGFAEQFISYAIGLVYPMYMSMVAIELSKKDESKKWLTYWVIFACCTLLDFFADIIIRMFPLYWYAKTVFLIWCYFPTKDNVCMMIHKTYLHPFYIKYLHQDPISEEEIERYLTVMKGLKRMEDTMALNQKSLKFGGLFG